MIRGEREVKFVEMAGWPFLLKRPSHTQHEELWPSTVWPLSFRENDPSNLRIRPPILTRPGVPVPAWAGPN